MFLWDTLLQTLHSYDQISKITSHADQKQTELTSSLSTVISGYYLTEYQSTNVI